MIGRPLRACSLALAAVALMALGAAGLAAQANVITGTPGDDVLAGTPGPDRILGLEGSDEIDGGEGDDYLEGGPGQDEIFAGGGNDVIEARDGEVDLVVCRADLRSGRGAPAGGAGEGVVAVGADPVDRLASCDEGPVVIGPGELKAPLNAPPRSGAPLHVVYDFAPIARALHNGAPGLPGLGTVRTAARQFPLGDPFPTDRWLSKVSHGELKGLSASAMAAFIERRLTAYRFGPKLGAELVAIDEVGVDAQDDGFGPRLLSAMKILANKRHGPTGEPLSRRVLMYAAPKMVANVGEPNDREDWDSAMAAARLAGGVYLQMYHAADGRITSVATAAEWSAYLPRWRAEMGRSRSRLRVLFTGSGPGQDTQWGWARATSAGRKALRAGAGAYRLGSATEARAWLRNWNRYAR